jgi:hypothetical protein
MTTWFSTGDSRGLRRDRADPPLREIFDDGPSTAVPA